MTPIALRFLNAGILRLRNSLTPAPRGVRLYPTCRRSGRPRRRRPHPAGPHSRLSPLRCRRDQRRPTAVPATPGIRRSLQRAELPTPGRIQWLGRRRIPADDAMVNGVLISLGRYQASADQGVVGESPEVDVIPSLRPTQQTSRVSGWVGSPPDSRDSMIHSRRPAPWTGQYRRRWAGPSALGRTVGLGRTIGAGQDRWRRASRGKIENGARAARSLAPPGPRVWGRPASSPSRCCGSPHTL
jgi:hypothetical protein